MEISQEIHLKSVFQGVFLKDNAKGFLNLLSKEPVHIFKWVKITTMIPQVQQVNVKEKNYGQFPEVFIKLYKKFWAISTIEWWRKKICRKTKKLQFDRVILRPGWNLPYKSFTVNQASGYNLVLVDLPLQFDLDADSVIPKKVRWRNFLPVYLEVVTWQESKRSKATDPTKASRLFKLTLLLRRVIL